MPDSDAEGPHVSDYSSEIKIESLWECAHSCISEATQAVINAGAENEMMTKQANVVISLDEETERVEDTYSELSTS